MGCCISKCKPKKQVSLEDFDHVVQDKLVISQAVLKTPKILTSTSKKVSPISPPSPTASTSSSVSSFTCTNSSNTISSYSTLSSGSSYISSSKDRSFSNEFLWSCVKENPHVIRINSIKECSQLLASPNLHAKRLDSPAKIVVAPAEYSTQQGANSSMRQKRVRSNSPAALNRQKSFRRDSERFNASSYSIPSRALTSPSPSRRFNGDSGRVISALTTKECGNYSKRMVNNVTSKVNSTNTCVSSSITKEHLEAVMSPYNQTHLLRPNCMMRNRETCIHRISSKIDEIAVEEALAQQDSECVPMEDAENPHISLDCFIFL